VRAIARASLLFVIPLTLFATAAFSQDSGQGAVVVRDTDRDGPAPIYAHEQGDAIEAEAMRGDFVAGYTNLGLIAHSYAFQSSNGRVHVVYFANKKRSGFVKMAWMDPADLRPFDYDCSCGLQAFHGLKTEFCSPFAPTGILRFKWNACFEKSRDAQLVDQQSGNAPPRAAESPASANSQAAASDSGGTDKPLSADAIAALTASPEEGRAGAHKSSAGHGSKQKDLTNADVISLVKAGLGDKVIIDKIHASSGQNFDTSTDALIHLKKSGVSSAIIDAIVKREASN
jgi:hypothetical protein